MANSNDNSTSDWVDCQGGEISGLVERNLQIKASSRRSQITQSLALAAGLLLMVGVGSMMVMNNPADPVHGGITCSDVIKNGEKFVKKELDAEIAQRIENHLVHCENCKQKLAMLRKKLSNDPLLQNGHQNNNSVKQTRRTTIVVAYAKR